MSKPVVFMFSGQGSHYYQMGRELFEREPPFREYLMQLDAVACRLLHLSIVDKLYDNARKKSDVFDELRLTHPAIFMLQCALAMTLRDRGLVPNIVLGASLGSYVAAAIAGCFSVEEGLESVIRQAQVLETHCEPGGMLAVLADPELFERSPIMHENSECAGINCPSHFVVSAQPPSLSAIEAFLHQLDVVFQRLAVPFPFHSRWVDAAEQPCRALSAGLPQRRAVLPIACCEQACLVDRFTPECFWRIARGPIRFQRTIEHLEKLGSYRYVDVGPSGTLATFVKYNLQPHSESEVFSTLSPFGQDMKNLQRLCS
jgi:acyl transferase domain-containing protein